MVTERLKFLRFLLLALPFHVRRNPKAERNPLTNDLRSRVYEKARCILPHDGVNKSVITGKRYEDHLREAGFQTQVIPNAGVGAARMRIEAVRRILPRCHFNEKRCEAGLEALAWFHERMDDHREVGLGPLHDWSSHAADAFGLLAISYEEPSRQRAFNRKLPLQRGSI